MTEPDRVRRGVWASLLRWRTAIVLLPLIVGLCYGGVVGARLLWAEVTPAAVPAPIVTCWDGSEQSAADCPAPDGLAGLRWVFPSFRPSAAACQEVVYRETGTPRPLEYACRVRIDGRRATIVYSQRSDLTRGLAYFTKRYDGVRSVRTPDGARLTFRDPDPRPDGTYEVTVALTTYPFAVTVTAANKRLRDTALKELVTFRANRFLTIQPPPTADAEPEPEPEP